VFEVREVLRLWLDGRSYRGIAELVPADRKTVTRVIEAAVGLGLDRAGGDVQLGDEFVGAVVAAIGQVRSDRHGDSWAGLIAVHDRVAEWVKEEVPARKMVELLAREGVVVPERTLNRYLAVRSRHGTTDRNALLFLSSSGGLLSKRTIHGVFQRLRGDLGWTARGAHAQARIHDLRHSFASVAVAGGASLPIIGTRPALA